MNEELKTRLETQGKRTRDTTLRYKNTKGKLEDFDALSRISIKAANKGMNLDDTKANIRGAVGRAALTNEAAVAEADLAGVDTDTKCLIAQVSLVCSETAAMSRISQ